MDIKEATALIENKHLLNQDQPATWADLGCGSGLFTRALCRYLGPGSKIYAVDKTGHPGLQAFENQVEIISLKSDFEKDRLPFYRLDGILMANSLHYVRDQYAFLLKCRQTYSCHTFLIVEYDTDIPVKTWVPYPVSFAALTRLSGSLGFGEVSKLRERPSAFGRSAMYAAMIG